jgi:hypothetical protein
VTTFSAHPPAFSLQVDMTPRTRLTQRDWQTIAAALAHYEASDNAGEMGWTDTEARAKERAVAAVRVKVWQRLPSIDGSTP